MRSWDEAKNSETPEAFFQQMAAHRSMVGQSLRLPSAEATPEQRKAIMEKAMKHYPELMIIPDIEAQPEEFDKVMRQLGAPEDVTGYDMPKFEHGFTLPDDRTKFLAEAAKDAGLTKRQFTKLITKVVGADAQTITEAQGKFTQGMDGLKNDWGGAYETRKGQVEQMLVQFGADETLAGNIMKDYRALDLMHKIAQGFGSEQAQTFLQSGGSGEGAISPDEAAERAEEVRGALRKIQSSDPTYQAKLNRLVHYEKLAAKAA